jgi:hypothetical protein
LNAGKVADHPPWQGLAMNASGGGWSHRGYGEYGWCRQQAGAGRPGRMRAMRRRRPNHMPPMKVSPERVPLDHAPFDKEALRERLEALQSEMAAINEQLNELEEAAPKEGTANDTS